MSFSKTWNCTRRGGSYNFSLLKNPLVQINSKLNSKPYDYLCLTNVTDTQTMNTWQSFAQLFWSLLNLIKESDVFTRKSQTETLPNWPRDRGQYEKTEVWDFSGKTEHSRLISCLLHDFLLCILPARNLPVSITGEEFSWISQVSCYLGHKHKPYNRE